MPLDEIARRAGVGAGTVHRHFPTKRDLISAVVVDRLAGLADRASALQAAPDPTDAFFTFLRELTDEAAHNSALTHALEGEGLGADAASAGASLSAALSALLTRAQRAGTVREPLSVGELHAIVGGVIAMERGLGETNRGVGLDIVIQGLRRQP
ncbi:MAG: regulatory protein TetR [Microbacteriaceae bacterium]|nr:regulatory protein TetR [Microbacteriaceae bacterium]